MERPTDAYKEIHNISLSKEDTLFGGQVSNLQVFFLYISFSWVCQAFSSEAWLFDAQFISLKLQSLSSYDKNEQKHELKCNFSIGHIF